MRIIVLDKHFNALGAVPLFRTLLWIRRYQKLGAFELYTSKDYFPLFRQGKYIYRNDADELGVIDESNYTQDTSGKREVYVKGNFAECLLRDRVIDSTVTLSGNLETSMRSLVSQHAIVPSDSGRIIERLRLGDLSGISCTINGQVTGENLSDELYSLGNTEGISHRIRYNYQDNDLVFEVWEGKDRRDSQTANSWAVFSNKYYNIRDASYTLDTSSYKNYAFVAGEGEGNDRTVVEVDLRSSADEERREIYVDARDLQRECVDSSGSTITYTESEYRALLDQRGREKLMEYQKVENVVSSIDQNANLVYKVDYDLGDYCTYVNTEIGVQTDQRITEITETYEGNEATIDVTFGNDGVTTVRQLIKREA